MSIYQKLAARIPFRMCSSGEHRWPVGSLEQARKCCNGYVRLPIPKQYASKMEGWLESTTTVDAHTIHWVYILLPESEKDVISRLREKCESVSWVFRMIRQD